MKFEPRMHELLNRERPGLLAVVGTLSRDNCPHLVPVWYRWDGQAVLVWTLAERAWVRNVQRDSKVGVSVQEGGTALMMKGRATVHTSDGPRWTRRSGGSRGATSPTTKWTGTSRTGRSFAPSSASKPGASSSGDERAAA